MLLSVHQAAAAAAVGSPGLGVMLLTSLALGLDPGLAALAGADTVLLAVLAGTAAGALLHLCRAVLLH